MVNPASLAPPCPHLPSWLAARPELRDLFEYHLCRAQQKWCADLPAQAILHLNRAFGQDRPDSAHWPWPALSWILTHRRADTFLGNPVRHFQHYASRIPADAPHREVRRLRAWISFHLSFQILPVAEYPSDQVQIHSEALTIPSLSQVLESLRHQRPLEAMQIAQVFVYAPHSAHRLHPPPFDPNLSHV